MIYFASGANRPQEIRGFSRIGHPIGVSMLEINDISIAELARASVPVMVDSGAFTAARKSITIDWTATLDRMLDIATQLGKRAYMVAPDVIGDGAATAELVATHADVLTRIAAVGNVIVPCHGAGTATWFAGVREWLPDAIAGLPSNIRAMSPMDVWSFCAIAHPARVHLLGKGPRSRGFAQYESAVGSAELLCDSNLITQSVGHTNGPNGGPRKLTLALAAASNREDAIVLAFGCSSGDANQRKSVKLCSSSDTSNKNEGNHEVDTHR